MADEIRQVLGFDVSQALTAIKQLDASLASFESRLQSTGNALGSFNQKAAPALAALSSITRRSNNTAAAVTKLSTAFQSVPQTMGSITAMGNTAATQMGRAGRATNNFAVSFETMTRVVTTQAIVRALNLIRRAVENSFQGFIEFQRQLSLIQSIEPGANMANFRKELVAVSRELNSPLLETTAALYNIISQQVEGASNQFDVLTASLRFAKLTNSSVDQSAQVLTSTLNAYGKTVEDVERVSSLFFRTIDLGDVTAQGLIASLGKVTPVAGELGVQLEELLAVMATLTIAGKDARIASTEISAGLTALIKPSEDMQKAFKEIGVETGRQAIETFGMVGAFEALIATTDGTDRSIGKLFRNVRAMREIFRLTGRGSENFKKNLDDLLSTAANLTKQKFEVFVSTNAEQLTKDFNKLATFFTSEVGESLVNSAKRFMQAFGGADFIISIFRALTPVVVATGGALVVAGTALAAFNLRARLAGVQLLALRASAAQALFGIRAFGLGASQSMTLATVAANGFRVALNALLAVPVAIGGGALIAEQYRAIFTTANDTFQRITEKARETQAELQRTLNQAQNTINSQIVRGVNQWIAIQNAAYIKNLDNVRESNRQLLDQHKGTLDRIIGAYQAHATQLSTLSRQAADDAVSSAQRQASAERALEDRRFEFQNRRFNQVAQTARLTQRAEQLASDASRQLVQAQTRDQQELALANFQRAQSAADQALSLADQTGNVALRARAEQSVLRVLEQQVSAEKQLQAAKERQAEALAKAAAEEKKRVDELKAAAADFLRASDLFDKKGQPLDAGQRQQNQQQQREALNRFFEAANQRGALSAADLFSFDQLNRQINQAVTQAEVQALQASPQSLNSLSQQIQGSLDTKQFLAKIAIDPSTIDFNEDFSAVGRQVSEQFSEAREAQQELEQTQIKVNRLLAEASHEAARVKANLELPIGNLEAAGNAILSLGASLGKLAIGRGGDVFSGATDPAALRSGEQAISALQSEMLSLSQSTSISNAELLTLVQRLQALQQADTTGSFNPQFVRLGDALTALQKVQAAQQSAAKELALSNATSVGELEARATSLSAQLAASRDAILNSTAPAAAVAESQGVAAAQAAQMRRELEASITAQQRLNALQQTGNAEATSRATGGLIQRLANGGMARYFNAGGFAPRGTDTVPAMLSRGEMVVNSQNTRRFFAQLQSINAGVQPAFRESGGSVTNITVGDIVVNGARQPAQTARAVMSEIRREERRGASSLRR